MATNVNNYGLPEGFTLDKKPSNFGAQLPEGFTLDQPHKEPVDNRNIVHKTIDKGSRLLTQGTIGALQRSSVPIDIPAIVSRKYAIANAPNELRQSIFSDIETLQENKARGHWGKDDQKEYDRLVDLIKHPDKMNEFIPKDEDVPQYDVGSLIESGAKKFGVDLSPKGADEMALRWIGFIKDPTKASALLKNGFNPKNVKDVLKALSPTGKEALRGVGAGSAIQYAAESELGPIGTMAAAIIGDLSPSLASNISTKALNFAKNPINSIKEGVTSGKKGIAKTVAAFTPRDKNELQKSLIKDFREAGIQADAGTITGNNLVKWVQSTLSQSGLTGGPLEEFKKSLTKNIVSEYNKIAGELGESIYESRYEAGQALKTGLKEARDIDLAQARETYKSAKNRAGDHQIFAGNVGSTITELEQELKPGSFKSNDQKAVLDIIDQVKKDVLTFDGLNRTASVKSLINDKIALNDAIDYEIQGGTKSLLKKLVGEIDKAIESYGETDPIFSEKWKEANSKFSKHAQTFRGKTISDALKTQDPSLIFSKMNTPHGIDQIRRGLSKTPEGRQLFNQLSRYKLEEMIGKNMVNSTTNQLNLGTFSKLLEKNQNRQIAKSLLGEESLKKLENLQKSSGRLAETAQKFLNTSRSGVHAADLALVGKVLMDLSNSFLGNPWPLMKSGGAFLGAKTASRLLADPEFLNLLEEAVLEYNGPISAFKNAGVRLADKIKNLEETAKAAVQTTPNQ